MSLSPDHVRVHAVFRFRPHVTEAHLNHLFAETMAKVRQEQGCIQYDMYRQQNDESGLNYALIECWESQEALNLHFKTPHMADFKTKTKDILDGPPDIQVYSKVHI